MYLGVVAKPIAAEGFDGKTFCDCVAETGVYGQTTYNQRFSDHYGINWQLRQSEWIKLLTDDMTLGDFKESMADNLDWNLDEDVVEQLVFPHRVGTNKDGSAKYKCIMDNDDYLWAMDRMRACELRVRYQGKTKTKEGDAIVRDVSCDSKYMDRVMPKVGKVRSQNLLEVSSPARLIVAFLH